MFLLKLLPAPLHRALYRLAHFARRCFWKLRRPTVCGVRVLAIDPQGHVLLVRHSYGPGKWMPPGGGLRSGEAPLPAAARELREETGCVLETAQEVTMLVENLYGARNEVHVIVGRTSGPPRPDAREIVDAGFFALDALPERMTGAIAAGVREWVALYRS
ncbi:NUDIX domain-containing protein [Novosphingobium malaysiense]|uniref:Nudix hydrolase domain-containing protein n=1 Tax=Novosphingobium malaysiense TaxID=1348853 RepID=A0A0B1ZHM9_9SPHN|nr:NUDIX domain-containing protein [Novosphingobium malaysiense]KHK90007.1 hypothetical protein LK12_19175 [Novosphingobium malaysiense]